MACYRSGGCGPYENRSCNECPASRPEYAKLREERERARIINDEVQKAKDKLMVECAKPMNIKIFIDDNGVMCVMTDKNHPIDVEVINVPSADANEGAVDAYINQLCGDGYVYVENIITTNNI